MQHRVRQHRVMRYESLAIAGLASAVLAATGLLAGCGLQVPSDPDGTLDRVTGAVMHAGASPDAGLVDVSGEDVAGPLPELVEAFAKEHDAEVEWTVGSEESLVIGLERGKLDIVIGGMTTATPWADRAAVSRGYPEIPGSDGRDIVLLVPPGENRLLSSLEAFLDEELTR